MNRKVTVALALTLALAFSLFAGCAQSAPSVSIQGVTDDKIRIGGTGAFTGVVSITSQYIFAMEAFFDKINKEGGINGRKIEFIYYNDGMDGSVQLANIKNLWENDKVYCVLTGTFANAPKEYVEEKNILTFAMAGAPQYLVGKYTFGSYPTFDDEARAAASYLIGLGGMKKIGLIGNNTDMGDIYVEVFEEMLKEKGIELVNSVYINTEVDYSSYVLKMKNAKVDALAIQGPIKSQAAILVQMETLGLSVPTIGTNVGGDLVIVELAGDASEGVAFTYMYPILGSDDPRAIAHEKFIAQYPKAQPASVYTMKGTAHAELIVEALRRAGDDLSFDNVASIIEGIQHWDNSVMQNVTYGPSKHSPSKDHIFIMKLEDGRFVRLPD